MKVVKKNPASASNKSSKKVVSKDEQARIDAILDKISTSGYDALTAEEKEILFRASNKK